MTSTRPVTRAAFLGLGLASVVAAATSCTTPTPASGATSSASNAPPLPTAVVRPTNPGNGAPFDGNILVTRSGARIDLAALGYVEEEYFVSGRANVYQYGPSGAVEVRDASVPYTTRIMVRRPRDPGRFSGTVQFDVAHPASGGSTFAWSSQYIIQSGHAFVTVTTRRSGNGSSGVDVIKAFDPVRYAPINFTEDGLTWDIIGQVGRLIRTQTPLNPLNGLNVQRVYAQGWSGSGALLLFYIGDGFHARARMPGGGPIFDGYLVGEPSGYPRINSTSTPIADTDPRQQVRPRDVPAITLHTAPQPANRRRADSDAPNDRYRVYEVPGSAHGALRLPTVFTQPAEPFQVNGPFGCAQPLTRFPFHHYYQSTLARIDAWSRGVTPPPSQRITLGPDRTPLLDANGNQLGGVRSTYLDVPVAAYSAQNQAALGGQAMCSGMGAETPFSRQQLTALYRNRQDYVDRVTSRSRELEREGWLLPYNAEEVRQEAQRFTGL